jgi:hypothetical protein
MIGACLTGASDGAGVSLVAGGGLVTAEVAASESDPMSEASAMTMAGPATATTGPTLDARLL